MSDAVNDFRVNTTFITVSFSTPANTNFLAEVLAKFTLVIDNLQQADDTTLILPYDPKLDLTDTAPLRQVSDLPDKMTALQRFFKITSRAPKLNEKATVWSNARISHDSEFEDILNLISYDLQSNDINCMIKRVQCCTSTNPGYFHFICNQSDSEDVYNQIVNDIGDKWLWTIYNRVPWEGSKTSKSIKKTNGRDTQRKALTVECDRDDSASLVEAIRSWITDGIARKRFGPHVKFVESINNKTSAMQIERTIRMNAHGRRFQASVGLMELCGLTNPDGIIKLGKNRSTTVRELITTHTSQGHPMFLGVTRKWQSSSWYGVYIKEYSSSCAEFAECPAAWLAHKLTSTQTTSLYKHFSPEAVEEASAAEWDDVKKRIITPKERHAMEEDKALTDIPWMIDLTALDASLDENQSVTFKEGVHFDFNDDISLNTTRVTSPKEKQSVSTTRTCSTSTKSILKSPSSDRSVTSEVTTETRLDDLESSVSKLESTSQQILALLQKGANVAPAPSSAVAQGSGDKA